MTSTNKRKRPATIKDIARALNISVSTVSRAMRDTFDVGRDTRERVLDMATRLNYRPNLNATGLVKRSTKKLAVIVPVITNYYFSTVITGIKEVARENDFSLVLHLSDDNQETETHILKSLSPHSADGLLICLASDTTNTTTFLSLIDDGLPIVFFDRVPEEVETSKVVQDDYNGAYIATKHLIEQGYQRIAHITGPEKLQLSQNRLAGYRQAIQEASMQFNPDYVVHSGFSQVHGEEDTRHLLRLASPPDAIFAVNDRKAIGAILAIKKSGRIVGKELGVVGFTNDPVSEIVSPTLSTVAEPAREIGRKSCELLIKHILKPNFRGETIVLSDQLIVRESTKR
jgi:DNA-binding LacI/PurR family transcriptional regulator